MNVNIREVSILFDDNSTLKHSQVPLFTPGEIIRTDSDKNKEGKKEIIIHQVAIDNPEIFKMGCLKVIPLLQAKRCFSICEVDFLCVNMSRILIL